MDLSILPSSNSTPNSQLPTPPRVELELCPIIGLHPPPYYFSELKNQVNKHLPLKIKGRELAE